MNRDIFYALSAAVLFGASTPTAKLLVGELNPVMLAALLYLGSGVGLALIRLIRDRGWKESTLTPTEWRWLLGAIAFGGVLGPLCLMFGLRSTSGSTASLLLNLEAVLSALMAWLIFKESVERRIVLGMAFIVLGGMVLSWPAGDSSTGGWQGPGLIALACLCWAIDNNLTRKVSANDAVFVASAKGLMAGIFNGMLALLIGVSFPERPLLLSTMAVGLLGYGFSLVLFVMALRGLGTARTGAYFSTAPFIGAAVSIAMLGDSTNMQFWLAAALMGVGVWLHLTEHHEHEHLHEPLSHAHNHVHDEHHQHGHPDGQEPHVHWHTHEVLTHKHSHFPDIHHRHER
jgi:drug/metabolite transporter (DMT)-like permease